MSKFGLTVGENSMSPPTKCIQENTCGMPTYVNGDPNCVDPTQCPPYHTRGLNVDLTDHSVPRFKAMSFTSAKQKGGETLDFNMSIGVPDTELYRKKRRMGEVAGLGEVRGENRAQDVDINKLTPTSGPVKSVKSAPIHM